MTRKEVYAEIEQMFGLVPTFFKAIPDNSLGLEWQLMKTVQFEEGAIPNKYRELIGLGIAATTKCRTAPCSHRGRETLRRHGRRDRGRPLRQVQRGLERLAQRQRLRLRHLQERSAADGQARPQPDDEVQRRLALRQVPPASFAEGSAGLSRIMVHVSEVRAAAQPGAGW